MTFILPLGLHWKNPQEYYTVQPIGTKKSKLGERSTMEKGHHTARSVYQRKTKLQVLCNGTLGNREKIVWPALLTLVKKEKSPNLLEPTADPKVTPPLPQKYYMDRRAYFGQLASFSKE